ncbi:MAG: hypothetical protein HY286_16755 [Planctomycetes bacterium]|nr:hypothetical protein [Planctomycetota bacterium]
MRRRDGFDASASFALNRIVVFVALAAAACAPVQQNGSKLPASLSSTFDAAPSESELQRTFNRKYFTEIGRQDVEASTRIVLGTVNSISRLPGGPCIARLDVNVWLLAADDSKPKSLIIQFPEGSLTADRLPALVFLAAPKDRGSAVLPLFAVARGDEAMLDARTAWVREDLRIAALATPEERIAATRTRLIESLSAADGFTRGEALRDAAKLVERDEGIFPASDASVLAALATRARDREFGLKLLDLAALIRARAK